MPSFPAIANDIKKAGVEEHGYTRTPLKAIHSLMQAWRPLVADLPNIKVPVIYFRSAEDHVVDAASEPIILSRISSTDVEVVRLPRLLPRRHPRQRRPDHLRAVGRVRRPGHDL